MKIAFTNSSNRLVGGAERYIETIASFLHQAGHETALWHEVDSPEDRQPFSQSLFAGQHCLEKSGLAKWLQTLEQWKPDLIFGHGLYDPHAEAEVLKVAPSVFFVHNYDRTCISGAKCHAKPSIKPCSRKFSSSCLLAFYPRRCGGLSPITLIRDYRRTVDRLNVMKAYNRVVTHTCHMAEEYRKNGIPCQAIAGFSCPPQSEQPEKARHLGETWTLLFIGRMTSLKGGGVLLDALPKIRKNLATPIKMKFLGDGPSRNKWERRAAEIERENPGIKIEFTGWITGKAFDDLLSDAHLHVLPSLWPEPFGMSGLELGLKSIPSVSFNIGGISDWLHDKINGILAEYSEPLADNLASAIIRALRDEHTYSELSVGAKKIACSMTIEKHGLRLLNILREVSLGNRVGVYTS